MGIIKNLVKKYLVYFSYFYSHLRYRVFIALALSLSVGLLDGFGLAMFLPLLQMVDGGTSATSEDLGGLSFLVESLDFLGIDLSLTNVLLVISVFFVTKGIAKFCESYYNVLVQQYFIKKLRYDNIDILGKYSYKKFVMADSGRIQNTLSGEVGRVSSAYLSYFAAMQFGVLVFVYVILAFLTNPQFAVLVAFGGFLSNFLYNKIYKKTKATSSKITKGGHVFQGLLIEKVAFFKYLRATGLMTEYGLKIKKAIDYIENSNKKIGLYNSILVATREPMVILIVMSVIFVQVNFFSEKIGVIVLSLLFFYRSLNALVQMQNHWNRFLNNSGSLVNMTEFMEVLRIEQEDDGELMINGFKDTIQLEDVSFSYRDTELILRNLHLTINKNKTYAFVGESGSGKTTLVNLIVGMLPANIGKVLVDDVPYEQINKLNFSKHIGYITQDPVIFSDSIFNNVTRWALPTSENKAKFWKALEKAAIVEFVESLPERENSFLGSNGVMVSGGQKQRISIARELFKDVDILIMDEATSALDSETERVIQGNIEKLKGEYTILIVAHRLSTIKSADEVILLNNGMISGRGTYHELMNHSQSFKKMVALQEV
ncbi:ABC transporter ATP-binding protein/permease [Algoriphagus sp. AGSA1]|uniref:ABC transporter ATP-binding protein n=1 Tax=Algoriphagus sp. AGSA1 TaxID=2907213 RepID=UPI001F32F59C|nr:ABC transporter ATP-binding protein [Algoriphagus sp. AGSA1]MCE7055308.1 ABC transporter ATP-binding protein/permease [Algoriphagus sp. AGSA1]